MTRSSPIPFLIFIGVCSLLSVGFLFIWGVNLNIALGAGGVLEPRLGWIPPQLLAQAVKWSADMSTVSTFIPFLITLFPAWIGTRTCRLLGRKEVPPMLWRPYPSHFSFFLIMLGLVGTLYGLLIGLESSGVEAVAGEMSAGAVRVAVDRLLSGTATAVLSSLVGIVGAFVAARPMAWLYCLLLPEGVQEEIEDSLEDTVLRITEGLGRMDHAVRTLTGSLHPIPLLSLVEGINRLQETQQVLSDRVQRLTEQVPKQEAFSALTNLVTLQQSLLDKISEGNSARSETLTLLKQLVLVAEKSLQTQGEAALSRQQLEERAVQHLKLGEVLTGIVRELAASQQQAARINKESIENLADLLRELDASRGKDRQAMRKRFLSLLAEMESDG